MTNKEAIEILNRIAPMPRRGDGKSITQSLVMEAIVRAIQALEQTSYKSEARRWKRRYLDLKQRVIKLEEQQLCEDAISRQDAVDIINGYAEQFNGYIGTPNDTEVYAYARGLLLGIESNISALPSVKPKGETITEFADRCRECGAKYGKLLKQEQKTGHWILGVCDECEYDWGKDAPIASVPNFCPNCGCRMIEPQESESDD